MNHDKIQRLLAEVPARPLRLAQDMRDCIDRCQNSITKGNGPKFQAFLDAVVTEQKEFPQYSWDSNNEFIQLRAQSALNTEQFDTLLNSLMDLRPWRKGPFKFIHGNNRETTIDAEWRSNLKWQRLAPMLDDLDGCRLLDIGCNNGWYLYKFIEHGARFALGMDPYQRYYFQWKLLEDLGGTPDDAIMLPCALEDMPVWPKYFDYVFCMGILYHRRSPIEYLTQLRQWIRPGGSLLLETKTVPGKAGYCLSPYPRYAKMHNCYFVPSSATLIEWLKRAGYDDIELFDETLLGESEQRKTSWVNTESLEDFIDPNDPHKTVEGYPAPYRCMIRAKLNNS